MHWSAFIGECINLFFPLASPSLSPALLPHDPAEEEGAGSHRGLRQSGVSPAAFSKIQTRGEKMKKETKTSNKRGTKLRLLETRPGLNCQNWPGRRSNYQVTFFNTAVVLVVHKELVLSFCFVFSLLYYSWTNLQSYFCLVRELAAVKDLYFDLGTVERLSEQWAELHHVKLDSNYTVI